MTGEEPPDYPIILRPSSFVFRPTLGATLTKDNRCNFCVWAPLAQEVDVHVLGPAEQLAPLARDAHGYYQGCLEGVGPGSLYYYRLNGAEERPDPASRCQPQGMHGPSQIVASPFPWEDQHWPGLLLQDYLIYELHVGAFTPEGSFEAIILYLDELKNLGVTAVELMPVAQFPGRRNWGYDGVGLFAAQYSYGGPEGLKRLVNACHQKGLAVVMDVVYNHLGPEGNHLGDFGLYFTERYRTPWGAALNFDGPHSDEVRRFFIENALYWTVECHIDALRLDAVHAILDHSPRTFLEELTATMQEAAEHLNRRIYLIAESPDNNARLIRSPELGGYGLDAQWSDDFHHCLHTLLTGESEGYYQDYGQIHHLVKAFREGFVYSGQYSPYRRRRHGTPSRDIPARRFVVCAQNHDQVGNRMLGERLSQLVSFEALKLSAGVLLLSPFIPLLFMGEEYGEPAPFPYFISHTDVELVEAVRQGRKEEFAAFQQEGEPPDPQAESVFQSAKLNHQLRSQGQHKALQELHRELIRLRREVLALSHLSKDSLEAAGYENPKALFLRRWHQDGQVAAVFHFGAESASVAIPLPPGQWRRLIDSTEEKWHGSGSRAPIELTSKGEVTLNLPPQSFILFEQ
jgi:maltooligosyltrehalose trehalohydrolase